MAVSRRKCRKGKSRSRTTKRCRTVRRRKPCKRGRVRSKKTKRCRRRKCRKGRTTRDKLTKRCRRKRKGGKKKSKKAAPAVTTL